VDIRRVGSGNVGATNVARSVGLPYGVLAFLLDWAKGIVAALMVLWGGLPIWTAGFAVVGHNWSLFMGLRSGKGVATSLGILVVISWPVFLITLALWMVIAALTRYVSVASVTALLLSPLWLWAFRATPESVGLMAALALLSTFQHRENFRNLLRGREHKLG
jgi:glycerol-3-phosphate acyltransferase PlsY